MAVLLIEQQKNEIMLVEILIPIASFALTFGIVFIFISTRHKERMKLIESGADPALFQTKSKAGLAIKFALLLIGIGIGIFIGNVLAQFTAISEEVAIPSMILIFAGSGLLLGNKLAKDQEEKDEQKKNI